MKIGKSEKGETTSGAKRESTIEDITSSLEKLLPSLTTDYLGVSDSR
jgi:hypothetical protein